jgi:integrase
MLALLIGGGLRRGELLALTLDSLQRREAHWVIADLVGKAITCGRFPSRCG